MVKIKLILALGVLIIVCACNKHAYTDYVEHKVNLKNNLGELSISLPPEFDTIYCWTNYSDNSCADLEMYRFANKKYSLLQEDGACYNVKPDSLYQLTIEQPKHFCWDSLKINAEKLELFVKDHISMNPAKASDIFIAEIRTIQERNFIVIGRKSQAEENCTFKLELTSEVNGQPVFIEFACQAKDCTNFIDRIEKSLNSIKINDYP